MSQVQDLPCNANRPSLLISLAFSLGLLLPVAAPAQDTSNPGECIADEEQAICVTDEPGDVLGSLVEPEHEMDWIPVSEVPRELRDRQCVNCGGRYRDPLKGTSQELVIEEVPIKASARGTVMQGDTVEFSGDVAVAQGYRYLRGDRATFNNRTRKGTLEGNISLREPGILLRGEAAEFDSRTGEAAVRDSRFVLHEQHMRGTAEAFRRNEEGLLIIEGGSLSYCAPDEKDWAIQAREIELDIEEGLGTARGAKFRLGGVPVLYLPWMQYPIDDRRRTGVLWPDIGTDSRGGLDLAVPVYWNIAPNYDLLYTPRTIQERGLNNEFNFRYLNRHIGQWDIGGAYMDEDDRYAREFPLEDKSDRWIAVVQHDGLINQRWRSRVDFSRASDENYLKDLKTSSLQTKRKTNLRQLAALDYLGDDWLVNLEVQQFQSLAQDLSNDYKKLPQLTGQYRGAEQPFSFNPIFLAQYSNFDTEDGRVTGERVYAEAGASYNMSWPFGFLVPTGKYRQLEYDLNDPISDLGDSSPSAGSALASLDGGLFFERSTSFAGRQLLQTLEPRLYYLYSEYEDQADQPDFDSAELTFSYNQLFRDTRFSGRDRLDDANQLSVGITTRFFNDEDGREQFNANIGQIFYFDDRLVRLKPEDPPIVNTDSEVASELNFFPTERVSLRSNVVWDPNTDKVNSGNLQAQYLWPDGRVANIGWSFRRPVNARKPQPITDQGTISGYFPLSNRWSLFASWSYSFEADRSVEDMVGVEYDTCCWMIRLLHLRYFDTRAGQIPDFDNPDLEREYSTQFQIVLKGMGGFGSRVSGLLKDMIRGFEEREY